MFPPVQVPVALDYGGFSVCFTLCSQCDTALSADGCLADTSPDISSGIQDSNAAHSLVNCIGITTVLLFFFSWHSQYLARLPASQAVYF